MSRPFVLIHVLGGNLSGRTTLLRRYLFNIFDNTYDPTLMEGPYESVMDFPGTEVKVGMERLYVESYRHEREIKRCIGPADAILLVMTPGNPRSMDETVKLRFEVAKDAIEAKAGVLERVVIMKDIERTWDTKLSAERILELGPEDIDDMERRAREEEWEKGAEKARELASRIGADVSIVCPRTGEGVKETVDDLVLKVLAKRETDAKEAKRKEEEAKEELRRAEEKKAKSFSGRFKRVLRELRTTHQYT